MFLLGVIAAGYNLTVQEEKSKDETIMTLPQEAKDENHEDDHEITIATPKKSGGDDQEKWSDDEL